MVRFTARYDGKTLLPDEPIHLPTDRPLQVTVEELPVSTQEVVGPNLADRLDQIEAEFGLAEGPADWSAELEHYLYGSTKRGTADGG